MTLHEIELVPAVPADACTQLTNSLYVYGSIALIERGSVTRYVISI